MKNYAIVVFLALSIFMTFCNDKDAEVKIKREDLVIRLSVKNDIDNRPNLGHRIVRGSDGYYECNEFERHEWSYKDSFIRIPLQTDIGRPIKLVAYDELKEFVFSIDRKIADTLTLHYDSLGYYVTSISLNKSSSINWMYQLAEVGIISDKFWDFQMPLLFRHPKLMGESKDKIHEVYFEDLKSLKNTITQAKTWLEKEEVGHHDSSIYGSFEHRFLDGLLYRWRIAECSFQSPPESIKGLWNETLSTKDTSLILTAYSLLPNYFSIPRLRQMNSYDINYFILMDSIDAMQIDQRLTKQYLKNSISMAYESMGPTTFRELVEKYIYLTSDSMWVQQFFNRNDISYELSQDLLLADTRDSEISLAHLISELNGKVIYIDFWASWCAPCLAAMPAAQELRDYYNDKNVAFVYLAFNDSEHNWRLKSSEFGLDLLSYNYRILNSRSSTYIDSINLKTIPRYLLFDQEGKLLNEWAFGPDNDLLKEDINKLLNLKK